MTNRTYIVIAVGGILLAIVCLVAAEQLDQPVIAVAGLALLVGVVGVREYWQHNGRRTLWRWELAALVLAAVVAALFVALG